MPGRRFDNLYAGCVPQIFQDSERSLGSKYTHRCWGNPTSSRKPPATASLSTDCVLKRHTGRRLRSTDKQDDRDTKPSRDGGTIASKTVQWFKELSQMHVVLVEKNRVRALLVREVELCSRVEYPSVLDEELHIWLRELATSKRKPKVQTPGLHHSHLYSS